MTSVYPRPIADFIESIQIWDRTLERAEFRRVVLDRVVESFRLGGALFVLADERSSLTDFMVKDIDEIWIRRYKDYYHQFDPFELIEKEHHGKPIIRMEELVAFPSFLRSPYYNEFLLPQRIRHKIISYLVAGKKTVGLIGFFRPRSAPGFSEEEVRMVSTLSPFIAHGLEHIDLRYRQRLQRDLLGIVESGGFWGLLIADGSMNPVFVNENARRVCEDLSEHEVSGPEPSSAVPSVLLEDCLALSQAQRKGSAAGRVKPVCRVIRSHRSPNKRYALRTKVVDRRLQQGGRELYAVFIDQVHDPELPRKERLDDIYGLTRREIDILSQLSRGLKNAEIARELCICEITVKKHIQRLFEKVGVSSRTALVHRTLIEPLDS